MITSKVNDIITRATDDRCGKCLIGAENIDIVPTTSTIDLKCLNATEGNKATCSGDHCFSDDKGVSNWCSYNHEGIDPRSTIDRDRAILEIAVAVATGATKEVRQVGDLLVVCRIITEDKESLEEEAVVPGSTMEVEWRPVVVHFKAVIFTLTVDVELVRGTIGKVINVRNGDTFWEFKSAVPTVWNEGHGADRDLVITITGVNERSCGSVIIQDGVVTCA